MGERRHRRRSYARDPAAFCGLLPPPIPKSGSGGSKHPRTWGHSICARSPGRVWSWLTPHSFVLQPWCQSTKVRREAALQCSLEYAYSSRRHEADITMSLKQLSERLEVDEELAIIDLPPTPAAMAPGHQAAVGSSRSRPLDARPLDLLFVTRGAPGHDCTV